MIIEWERSAGRGVHFIEQSTCDVMHAPTCTQSISIRQLGRPGGLLERGRTSRIGQSQSPDPRNCRAIDGEFCAKFLLTVASLQTGHMVVRWAPSCPKHELLQISLS